LQAILAMKDRNGSSLPAIKKYFKDNFPTSSNEPALKAALKHGVSKGVFVKVKASYKVSQDAKKAPKKKAATAKKPAAKKPEAAAAEPAKKTAAPRAKKAAAPKKVKQH
jgi:histone H1/5